MILDTRTSYPHRRAYVVKLHRDSDPRNGQISGQVEHVTSGRTLHFNSAEQLLACLLADLASDQGDSLGNAL